MYLIANVVYLAFASGEVQPWDATGLVSSKQMDIDDRIRKASILSLTMPNF